MLLANVTLSRLIVLAFAPRLLEEKADKIRKELDLEKHGTIKKTVKTIYNVGNDRS